ncbi:MAG: class I SAM-dependent methyltransferase [Flavobacteriales bacterium]|nr:class I SAM-dependent methyltransferase [Flavobacteriales bacterium]MDW8432380.1 class I SAM-dependent methyltransferase [Flavobacteriales bacterium]
MTRLARSSLYGRLTQQRSLRIALAVAPHVPAQSRVLDFGCGNGYTALCLAERVPCQMTGIDVIRDINLLDETALRIGFIQYAGGPLPFPAGSFDVVLASAVMHHTPDPVFYLDEFLRILQPGGRILLVEEMYRTLAGRLFLQAHDYVLNKLKKGVPLPLNFFSLDTYKNLFAERCLRILYHGSVRPAFPFVRHEVFVLQAP